jgi:hypothetical protein
MKPKLLKITNMFSDVTIDDGIDLTVDLSNGETIELHLSLREIIARGWHYETDPQYLMLSPQLEPECVK